MKFLIITKFPDRPALLYPLQGKTILDEAEADNIEAVKEGLYIPFDGECLIIPQEQVMVVK